MSVPKSLCTLLSVALLGALILGVCQPRRPPAGHTHANGWQVAGTTTTAMPAANASGRAPAPSYGSAQQTRRQLIQLASATMAGEARAEVERSSDLPRLLPPAVDAAVVATGADDDLLDSDSDEIAPSSQPRANVGSDDDLLVDDTLPSPPQPPTGTAPSEQLFAPPPPPHGSAAPHDSVDAPTNQAPTKESSHESPDPHAELFARTMYPSAKDCRECHEAIYEEWATSSHAYAAVSPMFQKFEQTMTELTKGTVGYFCMRCHSPVGTAMGYPRHASIWDAIPAAQEGVTCIACHRVRYNYTKSDGERRIEPGPIYDPVYGGGYGHTLAHLLQQKDHYKLKTSPDDKGPGQAIHTGVIHFEQLTTSHVCSSCHQVAVEPGIKLEVVWEQYRASPACKMGISCQDCHMGIEPGLPAGYATGPVAIVAGKKIDVHHKHSNHSFVGPGYSILHPGLFPWNPKAESWSPEEWMQFDYRAGWGTEPFERLVAHGQIHATFPPVWSHADDRRDAREILDANLNKLVTKMHLRRRLMENTSRVEGPIFDERPTVGQDLNVHYLVRNLNNGHNLPSGSLGAQPQLWLNVSLIGPRGNHLWESGHVDRNGDLADLHSLEVAAGRIVPDQQLFNLQTKFLITHVKGPDREMYLPVNVDFDQLPFLRPSPLPIKVLNHPPFVRMEAHSLSALGSRPASYTIPGHLLAEPGTYRLSVRMRSRAEPIYFMRFCGATPEMERGMNEWMLDFHERSTEFVIH